MFGASVAKWLKRRSIKNNNKDYNNNYTRFVEEETPACELPPREVEKPETETDGSGTLSEIFCGIPAAAASRSDTPAVISLSLDERGTAGSEGIVEKRIRGSLPTDFYSTTNTSANAETGTV